MTYDGINGAWKLWKSYMSGWVRTCRTLWLALKISRSRPPLPRGSTPATPTLEALPFAQEEVWICDHWPEMKFKFALIGDGRFYMASVGDRVLDSIRYTPWKC